MPANRHQLGHALTLQRRSTVTIVHQFSLSCRSLLFGTHDNVLLSQTVLLSAPHSSTRDYCLHHRRPTPACAQPSRPRKPSRQRPKYTQAPATSSSVSGERRGPQSAYAWHVGSAAGQGLLPGLRKSPLPGPAARRHEMHACLARGARAGHDSQSRGPWSRQL